MGHSRSVSAPDGPRLPSQPIIRRFELRNKSYSRTNFEPATREAYTAPAASSLPVTRERSGGSCFSIGLLPWFGHKELMSGRSGRLSLVGRTLAHYRINSAIGAGGMGEVYRATDMKLGRDVALKILPPDVASDPERLARFQREARAVAALNHPNVVTL